MLSIQALLSAPNPDDPLSDNIAKHWKTNEAEAVETGTATLQKYFHCLLPPVIFHFPRPSALLLTVLFGGVQRRSGLVYMRVGPDGRGLLFCQINTSTMRVVCLLWSFSMEMEVLNI